MTVQFPVHPDDIEMLLKIRRYLIGFRMTNGWTQAQLSQMINGTGGMVWDLESNDTWQWRLSRLQGWCVPFGLRLSAKVVFRSKLTHGFVHKDPQVAPAFALSQKRGDWASWQRVYLTLALRAGRQAQRIPSATLAHQLGITRRAIWSWEATGDELMLPKVLHHARALHARVELGLEDQ